MNKDKKKKRIILVVLGIVIAIAAIVPIGMYIYPNFSPMYVGAFGTPYSYMVYEDHVQLIGYFGEEAVVNIPERLWGRDVTVVGGYYTRGDYNDLSYFCAYNDVVQKVVFPDTVEEIGEKSFYRCNNLTEVILPSQLKKIGESAFKITSLKEIDLPDGLEVIGEEAFSDNKEIKRIEIPDTVLKIETAAFCDCTSLETVVLPDTVQVERLCFTDTPWRETLEGEFVIVGNGTLIKYNGNDAIVKIPDTVRIISDDIFENDVTETIIVPETVECVGSFAIKRGDLLKYVILQRADVKLEDNFISGYDDEPDITIVSADGSTGQQYVSEHPYDDLNWMSLETYEKLKAE